MIELYHKHITNESTHIRREYTFQKRFTLVSMELSFHQLIHAHVIELSPSLNIYEFTETTD